MRLYAVASSLYRDGVAGAFVSEDAGVNWRKMDDNLLKYAQIPPDQVKPSFNYIATSTLHSRTAYLSVTASLTRTRVVKQDSGTGYSKPRMVAKTGNGFTRKVAVARITRSVMAGWRITRMTVGAAWRSAANLFAQSAPEFSRPTGNCYFTDWYRAMKTVDGGELWTALYSKLLMTALWRAAGWM